MTDAARPANATREGAAPGAPSALVWAMIALLGLVWGGAFFLARIAVAELPPLTLVLLRVALAALTLHLVLALLGRALWSYRARWRDFLGMGLLNNAIPFSLLFAGQTALGAGLASILNATTPIWTVLIAHALTRDERISARKLAGVALGFVGVAVMLGPAAIGALEAPLWAMLCVVAGAISYGFGGIFGKRFADVPPAVTATGQLTASTLVMLPIALLAHGLPDWSAVSGGTWLAVVALATASTAFAYLLFFRILAAAGAVNVSLVTLLVPASAIVLGALFLDETLSAAAWAGLALIAGGLIVLDGRLVSRFGRRAREGR